jgi:hypothetical protein
MSTRNLLGGKVRQARKADNLTAICEPTVYKMCEPRRLTTLLAITACYRDSFTFYLDPYSESEDGRRVNTYFHRIPPPLPHIYGRDYRHPTEANSEDVDFILENFD